MNKLLILFFLAVSTVVFFQNKTEYHKISLKDKKDKASGFNFYIGNVCDGRQLKKISEPFNKEDSTETF
ncbi:hypothetical protein ACM55H_07800 [Flavobacterium sp. ZT3R17]|uniref:hypothetical protein n=1 Tax=Flavobacterium cryoconiti TaxID=3398736 RepID=UPI003A89E60C